MSDRAPANLRDYFTYRAEKTDGDYESHQVICPYWDGDSGQQFHSCRDIHELELRSPDAEKVVSRTRSRLARVLERVIRETLEQRRARLEVTDTRQLRLVRD